ncbi:MAG TPA: hypothetical protein VNJ10_14965 [Sphingomonas sp.]|nr:hypothetical protein [Sphingomonas sp.]
MVKVTNHRISVVLALDRKVAEIMISKAGPSSVRQAVLHPHARPAANAAPNPLGSRADLVQPDTA